MQRLFFLGIAATAISLAVVAAGRGRKLQGFPQQSSGSYSSFGDNNSHTKSLPEFSQETHNPDAKEQRRIRIKWGKAAMGYHDLAWAGDSAELRWIESDEPHRDLRVGIRGTLQIVSEDWKRVKPVDWVQGVRVVIARTSKDRPDWSKRHDERDSAWSDCVVKKDGTFVAELWPDQIRRPVGSMGDFQVALCLGTKSGRSITWKNSMPVLPQSMGTICIAGPKPLAPTLQAINGAPSVVARDFNPVMLVRAVNRLHALGKDKAIAELRSFLKIARHSFMTKRDPANIDTSDDQCVFLIVRLLFEPAKPGEKLPWMYIGAMMPSPPEGDWSWPLFPLTVQDDLPFILIRGVLLGGSPEAPSSHLDWAEKLGKLRAKPLRPIDDPLTAAERLLASPKTARLLGESDRGTLRRQAWQTIAHLAKRPTNSKDFYACPNYDADADWAEHKKIAARLKIRWSDQEQTYVME